MHGQTLDCIAASAFKHTNTSFSRLCLSLADIHELTEDECLKNFDALKSAIFAIDEEKIAKLRRKNRIAEASIALKKITL
jgi:hypothetical protein